MFFAYACQPVVEKSRIAFDSLGSVVGILGMNASCIFAAHHYQCSVAGYITAFRTVRNSIRVQIVPMTYVDYILP